MDYAIVTIVSMAIGFIGCWIVKTKAMKELKEALAVATAIAANLSKKIEQL